jgi:hypothetical protein
MGWLIAAVVVVALSALVWWSSGRAKPDLRRRSIETDIGINQGRAGMQGGGFDKTGGTSPTGGGGF